MSNSLDLLPLNQSKPEPAKRKRKSWKGVTSIRKSARLNKASVPLVIKTNFSDEESYHGYFEDNDNPSKTCIRLTDDESYHGESEDNEKPKEEVLDSIVQPLENQLQLVLYWSKKSNDLNFNEDKLRLAQEFITCPRIFYRFIEDPTITHSLHEIYEFLTINSLRSPSRITLAKPTFLWYTLTNQNRTTYGLNNTEMDHPWPILSEESHIKFCMLCPNQNPIILESIKQNLHQLSPSLTLIKHSKVMN